MDEIPGVHSNADLQANLGLAETEEGNDKGLDKWDMQQGNWECLGFQRANATRGYQPHKQSEFCVGDKKRGHHASQRARRMK